MFFIHNYHFFVFPTLTENYGHVIAESLICNCPVILSKGTEIGIIILILTSILKVILTFSTAQIFHLQKILRPFDTGSFSRRISPPRSASLTDHN